jgi:predicted RNase H-like HicB family nuclease
MWYNGGGGYRMKRSVQLTAIIEREDDWYVALCPEVDIASQGESVEDARRNLIEALELFFETASPVEIKQRLHSEVFITRLEVAVG